MSRDVSEPSTASASPTALAPSLPIWFRKRFSSVNEPLTLSASVTAAPPFGPSSLDERSSTLSEPISAHTTPSTVGRSPPEMSREIELVAFHTSCAQEPAAKLGPILTTQLDHVRPEWAPLPRQRTVRQPMLPSADCANRKVLLEREVRRPHQQWLGF
eukprot:scaffold10387_cov81-Phaeocystis_antarctica.AAC.1